MQFMIHNLCWPILYPISHTHTKTNFESDNSLLYKIQSSIIDEFVTRYVAIVILAFNCIVLSFITITYINVNGNCTNISHIKWSLTKSSSCSNSATITRPSKIRLHLIVSIVILSVHLSRINMMETASKPVVVWYKLTSIVVQTYWILILEPTLVQQIQLSLLYDMKIYGGNPSSFFS